MKGNPEDAQYIIYYIVCAVSIIGNTMVLLSLWQLKRSKSCFTLLLYFLHTTTLCMAVLSFPFVYKQNLILCQAVEGIEGYFAMMNLLTLLFLVETHRSNILEGRIDIKRITHEYGTYILLLIPCVVFFGFATGAFGGDSHDAFCILQMNFYQTNFLSFYIIWVWLFLIFCVYRIINTIYRIFIFDKLLAKRFFTSIGFYISIALFSWLPRTFVRFFESLNTNDDDNQFNNDLFLVALYPLQIGAILYCVIYFREETSIKLFEMYRSTFNNSSCDRNTEGFSFSWDAVITNEMLIKRSTASSISSGRTTTKARPSWTLWNLSPRATATRATLAQPQVQLAAQPRSHSATSDNPIHSRAPDV
jgi:hypothetical protein